MTASDDPYRALEPPPASYAFSSGPLRRSLGQGGWYPPMSVKAHYAAASPTAIPAGRFNRFPTHYLFGASPCRIGVAQRF
jgi:hypothetical protein